jgi:hypothetical protein
MSMWLFTQILVWENVCEPDRYPEHKNRVVEYSALIPPMKSENSLFALMS